MGIKNKFTALMALTAAVVALTNRADAASRIWTGAVSTEISDARNWLPNGAPTSVDEIIIGAGKKLTGDASKYPITVAGITVGAGSTVSIKTVLTVNGPLTLDNAIWSGETDMVVNGALTLTKSTWAGKGKITVNGPAIANASSLSGATFTINNTFNAIDCSFLGSLKQEISRTGVLTFLSAGGTGSTVDAPISNSGILNWNSGNLVINKALKNEPNAVVNLDSSGILSGKETGSLFENSGKVKRSTNGNSATISVPYTNTGVLEVDSGTLHFSKTFEQTSGECNLNGGDIKAVQGMTVKGGVLAGSGTVNGDVVVDGGKLAPGHSPGFITINGNYTQSSTGSLDMQIAGTTAGAQYDQLIVNGTATLAGTINLTYLDGFMPRAGDNFQLLTYYGLSGAWSSMTGLSPSPTVTISNTYTPTYFVATAKSTGTVPTSDTTPPSVSVVSPLNNAASSFNPAVTGTAADSESGLASVTISLYRFAAGSNAAGYWNGTNWDATYAEAKHERAVGGTLNNWTLALPPLADGKYQVRARAKDKSGNVTTSTIVVFFKDSVAPPTLTISSPVNAYVNSLDAILGTVADESGGSGLASVELALKRNADSNYWTDLGWITAGKTFKAVFESSSTWARRQGTSTPLPAGINLKEGAYTLAAKAYDKAGNVKSLTRTFSVDATAPTLKVTAPLNNSSYSTLKAVTGTAVDTGGSGLGPITVRLYRYATATSTAGYWAGGTNWTAAYSSANEMPATGTGSWSLTLPTLTAGNYFIQVTAFDKAGNKTSMLVLFSKSGTAALTTSSAANG